MGLSLLAGCDNEKQQIFKEAEKDLEQGSYEYALDEFTTSVNNGVKPAVSYRGIGICQLRLGNYDDAITAFTSALGEEKVSKSMVRDLYLYRATARLQAGYLDDAMADCQVLAQNYEMDADAWFLTGKVALEMDGYDEAAGSQNKSEQFLFHSDLLLLSVSGRIHKVGCLPKNKGGSVRGTEPPRV